MWFQNSMHSVVASKAGERRQDYLHRVMQCEENLWMVALAYGYQSSSCLHYRPEIATLEMGAGVRKTLHEVLDQMDACIAENEHIEFYWHESLE